MIDRVLEKEFVLARAEAVLDHLRDTSVAKELAVSEGEAGAEAPTLDEVRSAIAEAVRQERLVEAGVEAEQEPFIPTNAALSVLQTVIEERLREEYPDMLRAAPEPADAGGAAATESFIGPAGLLDDAKLLASIAKAVAQRLMRKRHGFVRADPPPSFQLDDDARIVLVGDWGMGNTPARAVSKLIEAELAGAGNRQTHVIHLGDVYYSGDKTEAQRHFLDPWPVKPGDAKRCSWCLNGNHDMYSGGHGYFETILRDDRFRHQRTADGRGISYFRLHNEHWQFLGLDTAWDQHLLTHHGRHGFLQDPQADWVLSCVRAAKGRTVLLTHHQFLSEHHTIEGNLKSKLRPVLQGAGGIDAWFWGHEHICMRFPGRADVRYAACTGHGSIPHRTGGAWSGPGGWEYDDGNRWRWCGYAVLDLQGARIGVRYVDQQGNEHHPESLPA